MRKFSLAEVVLAAIQRDVNRMMLSGVLRADLTATKFKSQYHHRYDKNN